MNMDISERLARQTRHLPRNLAIVAVAVCALLFLTSIPYGVTVWLDGDYALWWKSQTGATLLMQSLMPWTFRSLFAGLLAWMLMRGRLDRAGPGQVQPVRMFWAFLVLFVLLAGLYQALWLWKSAFLWECIFGWLDTHGLYHFTRIRGLAVLAMTLLDLASHVAVLLVAFWGAWAIGRRPGPGTGAGKSVPPPRYAVPILCGLLYVVIQWLLQDAFSGWLMRFRHDPETGTVLWSYVAGTGIGLLVAFVLAFAGASLGAGRAVQMRPLRALSAALLTLVVQLAFCVTAALCWLLVQADDLNPYANLLEQLIGLILFVVVLYLGSLVVLMRWFTGMLYERIQVSE